MLGIELTGEEKRKAYEKVYGCSGGYMQVVSTANYLHVPPT